jgi:chaperonin cofactor prefoldin
MSERMIEVEKVTARLEERVENLEHWQKRQNGSLQRIEERLHSLERWIMATLAAALTSIAVNLLLRR